MVLFGEVSQAFVCDQRSDHVGIQGRVSPSIVLVESITVLKEGRIRCVAVILHPFGDRALRISVCICFRPQLLYVGLKEFLQTNYVACDV